MIVKILVGSLLALSAANAIAGNMDIYKDKEGKVLLTNVNQSGNFEKFTKKVKVTYPNGSYSTPKKIDNNVYLAMADKDDSQSNEVKKEEKSQDTKIYPRYTKEFGLSYP